MSELNEKYLHKRVMVVDDCETERLFTSYNINKHRFAEEVILKGSPTDALAYLKLLADAPELFPKFIFLDIHMPEMDGFGFLEEYEKIPETMRKNCSIIMLSSTFDEGDVERAKKNKLVNQFLNK